MSDFIDKIAIKFIKWRILRGFGAECEIMDYDDYPKGTPDKRLNADGRCGSCQAKEVIEWLDFWQKLISKDL